MAREFPEDVDFPSIKDLVRDKCKAWEEIYLATNHHVHIHIDPTAELNSYTYEEGTNMSLFDPEFYLRESARLAALAEQLKDIPMKDPFEVGQVITFERTFSGQEYLYAAIKAGDQGLWYTTGAKSRQAGQTFFWEQLLEFIGIANLNSVGVVTNVKPLKGWKVGDAEVAK